LDSNTDPRLRSILDDISSFPDVDEEEAFKTFSVVQKNVLLLGKSGTGKSTLFEVLRDPTHRGNASSSLFSKTINAEYHPLVIFDPSQRKYFSINIIDTPGLFEQRAIEADRRENTEIFSVIRQCLKKSVTMVSTILLVLKMNDKFSPENMRVLQEVSDFLGEELMSHTVMVFTNAEDCAKWNMDALVLEFFSGEELKKYPFNSIAFTGAVDKTRTKYTGYVPKASASVLSLRQHLIKKIISYDDVLLPDAIIDSLTEAITTTMSNVAVEKATTVGKQPTKTKKNVCSIM